MSAGPVPPPIRTKWRPSLAIIIGITLTVVMTLPLAGMGAVVMLSRSPDAVLESLSNNADKIAGAGVVIVAVAALVGFLLWRSVTRPIQDLVRWTEAVASRDGSIAPRNARHGTRELARLAGSFSQMVTKLRERSDYIETFTAHVSHELKSPLTSIAGAAELMRDAGEEMDAAARARFLENIETDAARLSALVARMRDLARAENARRGGSVPLPLLLERLRDGFPALAIGSLGEAACLPLPLDDALVVFSQLADNAVRHGARQLTVRLVTEQPYRMVDVWNDGEAISPGNRARIFEPFYTTRRDSGGTGMGLAIARAMLRTHGGDIAVDGSSVGATFRIVLPVGTGERRGSPKPSAVSPRHPRIAAREPAAGASRSGSGSRP